MEKLKQIDWGTLFIIFCVVLSVILLLASIVRATPASTNYYDCLKNGDKKKANKPVSICPQTKMGEGTCMSCHVMRVDAGKTYFGLQEVKKDAYRKYPNDSTKIDMSGNGRFFLQNINDTSFRESLNYFYEQRIKKVIIEIHSPGGSLFNAWRIKGMIDEAISNGIRVETRLYGIAASAGFLIFVSGQDRVTTPTAECMWHELITGEWLAIKTPSDKEDEAKILRHLQDVANSFISGKSTMSKDELDAKIRKKEFWISGKEAFELGFATRLIGK